MFRSFFSVAVWAKKYAPETLSEVIGNEYALKKLKKWAFLWSEGNSQMPLLLSGTTGVGKTACVYALAKDFDFDLLETNASDTRKKDFVEKLLGAASQSSTLSGRKRIILIDEADGLQGNADRGGASAILKVLKGACVPVILTASDAYARSLQLIRKECTIVKFKEVNYHDIALRLLFIAKEEGVAAEQEAVEELARDSSGDVRSCINDFQVLCAGKKNVSKSDLDVLGFRKRSQNVKEAIRIVFNSSDYQEIRSANWSTSVDPDLFKKWIVENVPYEYEGEDVVSALNQLSRADVFDGRILNRQCYGFLRYSNELVTAGVAFSRSRQYDGQSSYRFPSFILKLSAQKSTNALKKEIGLKISLKNHVSVRDAVGSTLPYLSQMFEKENIACGLTAFFGFDEKEVAFITGRNVASSEVKKVCEKAREIEQNIVREHIHLSKSSFFWGDDPVSGEFKQESGNESGLSSESSSLNVENAGAVRRSRKGGAEDQESKDSSEETAQEKTVTDSARDSDSVQTNLFGF